MNELLGIHGLEASHLLDEIIEKRMRGIEPTFKEERDVCGGEAMPLRM